VLSLLIAASGHAVNNSEKELDMLIQSGVLFYKCKNSNYEGKICEELVTEAADRFLDEHAVEVSETSLERACAALTYMSNMSSSAPGSVFEYVVFRSFQTAIKRGMINTLSDIAKCAGYDKELPEWCEKKISIKWVRPSYDSLQQTEESLTKPTIAMLSHPCDKYKIDGLLYLDENIWITFAIKYYNAKRNEKQLDENIESGDLKRAFREMKGERKEKEEEKEIKQMRIVIEWSGISGIRKGEIPTVRITEDKNDVIVIFTRENLKRKGNIGVMDGHVWSVCEAAKEYRKNDDQ